MPDDSEHPLRGNRRGGGWRRNLAVAMGNALASPELANTEKESIRNALNDALPFAEPLVAEHIEWALASTPS